MQSFMSQVWSWTRSIATAVVITVLVGTFVFQPNQVSGHSMDPTLHDKQRIYVSKLSHTFGNEPDYGEIVIIDSRVERTRGIVDDLMEQPLINMILRKEDTNRYVKRVIGKAGDTLEIKDHQVYRNGELLDEAYLNEPMRGTDQAMKWTVPEGHVFVMGDNRNNSRDSRSIGFVPLDHVLGIKL